MLMFTYRIVVLMLKKLAQGGICGCQQLGNKN